MSELAIQYGGFLLRAAGTTLWISWLALLLAVVIGSLIALMRVSSVRVLRAAAILYVELFRSVPVLLVMFFCFFGVPLVFGIDVSAFAAATAGLSLFASSAMSEAMRAGLQSVGKGQWEAAQACGLHHWNIVRLIVLPQAVPVMLPPAVSVYIGTLKESSLAAIIGYVELTKTGLLISDSTGGAAAIFAVALMYFVMNYGISRAGQLVESRFAHGRMH